MDLKSILIGLSDGDVATATASAADGLLAELETDTAALAWFARHGITWTGESKPAESALPDDVLSVRWNDGQFALARAVRAVGDRLVCRIEGEDEKRFGVRSISECDVEPKHKGRFAALLLRFQAPTKR